MIFFLIDYPGRGSVETLSKRVGAELGARIKFLAYEDLALRESFDPGAYIFGNSSMLSPAFKHLTDQLADSLSSAGRGYRVLNHPRKVLDRFDLLQKMVEEGYNDFHVFRVSDWPHFTPSYPAFVRQKDDHAESLTDLIYNQHQLDREISRLTRFGRHRAGNLIVVEFCDVSDEHGLFRKYSAVRVGDTILTRCLNFGTKWITKHNNTGYRYPGTLQPHTERIEEEILYMKNNPHEEWLRCAFSLAEIDYGRIDYGMLDQKPQLWEINTFPKMGGGKNIKRSAAHHALRDRRAFTREHFYERFGPALESIEPKISDGLPITLPIPDRLRGELLRQRRHSRVRMSLNKMLVRTGWNRQAGNLRKVRRALGPYLRRW